MSMGTRLSKSGNKSVTNDLLARLAADHGPWALLVFYLLWRDVQKDQATRAVLDKNALVLTEIATVIKERMPRGTT